MSKSHEGVVCGPAVIVEGVSHILWQNSDCMTHVCRGWKEAKGKRGED